MTSEQTPDLRAYINILYESLKDQEDTVSAIHDFSPLDAIATLLAGEQPAVQSETYSSWVIDALSQVSTQPGLSEAAETADHLFETLDNFSEAIFFARWLPREPANAIAVMNARHYVESAIVPDRYPDLLIDQEAVLESTRFSDLWRKPRDFGPLLGSLEVWPSRFAPTYVRAHRLYHQELTAVAKAIDNLNPRAMAVERLNGLRRLGPPVATAALDQFHELERLYACPISADALAESLREAPGCPECQFELGRVAPTADGRRVRQAIERGLIAQQRRLAQRVVSRLLELPSRSEGERLARFVQVVQASDLAGLALVLDDTIIEFLRDFLEPPTLQAPNLVERLATSFPEVTLANLDAAVAELRRLLTSDVVANGGLLRLDAARQDT